MSMLRAITSALSAAALPPPPFLSLLESSPPPHAAAKRATVERTASSRTKRDVRMGASPLSARGWTDPRRTYRPVVAVGCHTPLVCFRTDVPFGRFGSRGAERPRPHRGDRRAPPPAGRRRGAVHGGDRRAGPARDRPRLQPLVVRGVEVP